MKKLIFLLVFCISCLFYQSTNAQISFRLNISSQPIWGPVGYDHVEYYYLPDIDVYYSVPMHRYIYMERGHWVTRTYLPVRYKNYNLYNARKIVINEPKPYLRHNEYKSKYAKSNEHLNQISIRDSHDSKYFEIKNHPEHSKWNNGRNNRGQDKKQSNERERH